MIATTATYQLASFPPGSPPPSFSFGFNFEQTSEILAVLYGTGLAGVTLSLGVDYTVATTPPAAAGTINVIGPNWAGAYAAYGNIRIYRKTAIVNGTSLVNGGAIDANILEFMVDEITQIMQEQGAGGVAAIFDLTAPVTDPPGLNYILPSASVRANTGLLFDANGNVVAGSPSAAAINAALQPALAASSSIAAFLSALGINSVWQSYLAGTNVINAAYQTALAQAVPAILAATIGKESYTPTSGYTPAANDVIELNYDGTIRKSKRVNTLANLDTGGANRCTKVASLDAYHFMVVAANGLNIIAQVYAVDPISLLPSPVGSPQTVFTCTTVLAPFDVSFIDVTTAIIGYTVTGGSFTQFSVKCLSAINVNTGAFTINAAINGAASARGITFTHIPGGTNTLATYFSDATHIAAVVISMNVLTPVIGTPVLELIGGVAAWNNYYEKVVTAVNSSGSTAVVIYTHSGATPWDVYAYEWSISGTTIAALGTGHPIGAQTWTYFNLALAEGPLDCFLSYLAFQTVKVAGGAQGICYGFSQVGLTSTGPLANYSGPPLQDVPLDSVMYPLLISLGGSSFFIAGSMPSLLSSGKILHVLKFIKKTGGGMSPAVASGDEFRLDVTTSSPGPLACAVQLSSGLVVGVIGGLAQAEAYVFAMARRNKIIGLAVDNAGTVQRNGIFVTTGLTPGSKYFSDDNGALTTTPGEVEIGYAIDATHLALAVKPGV